MKKPKDLPNSEDQYWDGEKYTGHRVAMAICDTHGRENWMDHKGYVDNHDGTAMCKYCGWGFRIPGYLRIHEGKVYDLRKQ